MNESRACMRYVRRTILRSRATTACLLPEHSLEILPRHFTPTDPRRPSWPHSFEATACTKAYRVTLGFSGTSLRTDGV